jgi:hypothetical protein
LHRFYSHVSATLATLTFRLTGHSLTICKVRSERRCALRLRKVGLVVTIEVAVAVCCCFTVFRCKQRLMCNTGKVCRFLLRFHSLCFMKNESNSLYKSSATFQRHFVLSEQEIYLKGSTSVFRQHD